MDYRIKLYRSIGDFETASEKYIEKRVLKKSEKILGLFCYSVSFDYFSSEKYLIVLTIWLV